MSGIGQALGDLIGSKH